jgi:hypothetical protein
MRGFLDNDTFNIAHFLFERNCFLKDYKYGDGRNAPGCIGQFCRAYDINPKMILATLQKEHSILSKPFAPEQAVMDKICGVGVWEKGKPSSKYFGFEAQIAGACATYDRWFNGYHDGAIAELTDGKGNIIGSVICESPITFALLKYTPRIESGLHLAEKCYTDYFKI